MDGDSPLGVKGGVAKGGDKICHHDEGLSKIDLKKLLADFGCVCCSVLQSAAVCCSVLQCVAVYHSVFTMSRRVLQCVAVCCSALQYVAVCCIVFCCCSIP